MSPPHDSDAPLRKKIQQVIMRLSSDTAEIKTKIEYEEYLRLIDKYINFSELLSLLESMLQKGFYPHPYILDSFLRKLIDHDSSLVQDVYQIMVKRNAVTSYTYVCVIYALEKSTDPDISQAMQFLEEAKRRNLLCTRAYNVTLHVIAKGLTPDVSLALALLEEAKRAKKVDLVTYFCVLDVMANSQTPDTDKALSLLDEMKLAGLVSFPDIKNNKTIDLHKLSYGSTYFWLKKELALVVAASEGNSSFSVVYGRGLHTKDYKKHNDIHPLKGAVLRVIEEIKHDVITFEEDRHNAGRVFVTLRRSTFHCPNLVDKSQGTKLVAEVTDKVTGLDPNSSLNELDDDVFEQDYFMIIMFLNNHINTKTKRFLEPNKCKEEALQLKGQIEGLTSFKEVKIIVLEYLIANQSTQLTRGLLVVLDAASGLGGLKERWGFTKEPEMYHSGPSCSS